MANKNPAVSVIIPAYNSSATLRLAIESVLRQDYADFELIVVGDGCTDDSAEVVSSFGDERLTWLNLPENSGTPSRPRNEALRLSQSKFIAYLGHDDLWFPWHLSGLVDSMESGCDLAYSLGAFIEPGGIARAFSMPADAWSRSDLLSPSNCLHRRELIESVGLWPEEIKAFVDREFLQRVLKSGAKLEFRQELSVLKFPAGTWHLYARGSALPQASYMESIRDDADQLRLEIQTLLAAGGGPLPEPPSLLKRLLVLLVDTYGRHRWPVNGLLYKRQQWMSGLAVKPSLLSKVFRILG